MNSTFVENPLFPQYVELVLLFVCLFAVSFFLKKGSWVTKVSGAILIFLPIRYFYLLLLTHAINVPFTDD
ncbi:hypothetical protein [Dyadobacter helix]|uniref:hypothetical protein n=1 Tax=Dyadobacter helix TaxID=2822344 RepID=UPI001BFCBD01|nr:hypothetical protein [Dyadobacter sp. CECT 9275]